MRLYTLNSLSTDVKASSVKVVFNIIRGCKTKDYPDDNGAIAWEIRKNTYDPVSALW
jgi:hypothetical protein